jgi:peptidoglycan/xylan/chitin deacetylase (PgdA/CDA1 family)
MKKFNLASALGWTALLVFLGWGLVTLEAKESRQAKSMHLALLIPDEAAMHHPVTQAWLDAAREEGFDLQAMTDDAFMLAWANHAPMAGVILPDTVHRRASDVLINALHQYTEQGGQVLVGFDAAVLEPQQGLYAARASRLSRLVGVSYALYEQLQDETMELGPVYASREAEKLLAIQPGKLDFETSAVPHWGELTTYSYPTLTYSHFKTSDPLDLNVLLQSSEGDPIVATRAHGQGSVMFANVPLGYLKTRTDSYLLHIVLKHFAQTMAQQAMLSSTPQAKGGMVLNLHLDSNAAQKYLKQLEDAGWFDEGPFSIHITAGPDSVKEGDHLGIDLEHNPWMQHFLERQHANGHEIGNHGGWQHNAFGTLANDSNGASLTPYLDWNQRAVSLTIGQRAVSYSAPMGNQPDWVTAWLRQHEFKGYYSTSDTGLGPTRSYIQGQPAPASGLWTFPISNFKRIATAEEMESSGLDEIEFNVFIKDLLHHVSQEGVARLFYFHPTAFLQYSGVLEKMRSDAKVLKAERRFRWYSMAELSDFQNQRMLAQWTTTIAPDRKTKRIAANTTSTLRDMTWVLPTTATRAPHVTEGDAQVTRLNGQWKVVAGDSQTLKFEWSTSP